MFLIDGKPVDLTNPSLWGGSIKLKPGGSIQHNQTRVEAHQPWCDSVNTLLLSNPPQPAKCNCKGN
jgi:hypothetical protein